jgi:hypothetical protein
MVVFEVCREALPAFKLAPRSGAEARPELPVRVVVFPHLSEQGMNGEIAQKPIPGMESIAPAFKQLFRGVRVQLVGELRGHELDYVDSSLERFLNSSWSHLRRCNVLVTHRNFLANEVIRGKETDRPSSPVGAIPNGGVVLLRVTRRSGASEETKKIFFLRHCTSHHNASGRGDGRLTTCATVEALRQLVPELRRACQGQSVLYGSSILPRAILSSISLQRALGPKDLERARKRFQPETLASSEEVEAYVSSHACRAGSSGAFCSGSKGCWHVQM